MGIKVVVMPRKPTHGWNSRNEAHQIWQGIKKRCFNEQYIGFKYYGGRGISICEEWKNSIDAFMIDMGPRPSKNHSVDRIDNKKGYSPKNCRWATGKEQCSNRRNTPMFEINGETRSLKEWCDIFKTPYTTAWGRIFCRGVSPRDALALDRYEIWQHK